MNKSQLFVGLLGSRYGHIPPNYNVSDPKEFAWLSDYPQDRSVTELEIVNFVFNPANKTDKARRRSLFYFRDGKFPSKVPPQWREDFSSEDLTALGKLTALKRRIHQANMRVKENYPCEWGGIREGKPIAAGLTVFAQSVLTDLWSAVKSYHQDEFESDTEMANRSDKNVYIPELTNWRFAYGEVEKFAGRKKLLSEAIGHLKKFPGGILLLTGTSGVGKTSVAAKLATESRKFSLVVTSFAHIQPELSSLNNILTHLANSIAANLTQLNVDIDVDLDAIRQNEVELSKFLEIIRLIAIKLPLAIVLDGYNSGVINPLLEAKLVPNVNLVVSSLEGSPCAACACRIAGTKQLRLGGLELADRPEVIRRLLLGSGKALGESAFDGQLRLLTSKRDADKPAYLQIACEYLRVSGDHQKLTAQIRAMPSALPNLVRSVVGQLDMDFGANLVRDSLIFLTLGEGQLSRTDLFNLVDIFQQASNSAEVNWSIEEIGKSSQRLPQSTFVLLMNSLNAVLREVQNGLDEPNVQFVSQSITDLMIKTKLIPSSPKNPERKYLQALIAYFASLCESQSRRHDNVVDRKIPALLVKFLVRLGDWARLAHFLCSLDFVELCFKLGAVGALIPVYQICSTQLSVKLASLKKSKSLKVDEDVEFLIRRLDDFNQFVNENLSLLTVYPTLIGQQAINQPVSSEVYCLAVSQYLVKIARSPLGIRWENRPPPKDDFKPNCYRTIRLGVELTCVAVDLKGHFVAVGSSDAQLRLFDFQSGSEIFNFVGHSQAITSVSFLDANGLYLCSCGADGNIFVWNTSELSKLVSLKGHTGVVSCCRPFKWSKVANLVTVGWDKTIRLWNFLNGKLVEEISTDSPISTFDLQPETQFIATGHWDSTVKIYSLAPIARKAVLRGHHSSVRSVAYNRDGQQIISACRDGQVRLWSAKFGCQLGSILAAHSLPVSQLTFLLDSNTFATAGEDSTLKLWASQLGQPVMTINLPVHDQMVDVDRITSVLIGPEGKSLLVGHGEGNIRHYNVELKSELQHIKIRPAAMILSMKRFGPTAANNPMDLVMVATNISASIVSLKSGKVPFTLDSGGYCPISSADVGGDLVATGHSDGSVRLYDVTAAKWKKQNS